MDKIIKLYDAVRDNDLMLCESKGVAYQHAMPVTNNKGHDDYFKYCDDKYSDKSFEEKINCSRCELINKHLVNGKILDIGIGNGSFIKYRNSNTWGYDVDKHANKWLEENKLNVGGLSGFNGYTFWDVLEHCVIPDNYFKHIGQGSFVFLSVPIFNDLKLIRKSKHYRPDEHVYYFTEKGLIEYMFEYGFSFVDKSDSELKCGRDGIIQYVFKKDLPDYGTLVGQYADIHAREHYGSSATDNLKTITNLVKIAQPKVILDYGCGRSDLATYFYMDGARTIFKYDPAIPKYKTMPDIKSYPVNLLLCCDVMEHVRKYDMDRVLTEIKNISKKVIFSISCVPARKKLPNGMNAHVNVEPGEWWSRIIRERFGLCLVRWKGPEGKTFICTTF